MAVAAAVTTLVGSWLAAGPASADPGFSFQRIGGTDRFDTSALVAQSFGDSADVVLANGQDGRYVDALAASYLAGSLQAPILLTRAGAVPTPVAERLEQSRARHVWVVGGPAAVSDQEVEHLRDEGYDVTRVAGRNRYLTDAAVIAAGGSSQALGLVATGTDFADALAGSSLAYQGLPLGLADGDSIGDAVISALKAAGVSRVLIIGGPAAVGPDVPNALEAHGISVVDRLQGGVGTGRAATSVAVANYALAHLGFSDRAVNVASGYADGYGADALAGGALTGSQHRPLLVTTDVDDPSAEVLHYLDRHADTLTTGIVFGGTGAVGNDAQTAMAAAATTAPATPPPPVKDPLLSEQAVAYGKPGDSTLDRWVIGFDHDLAPGLVDDSGRLAIGVSITLEDSDGQQVVLDHDNTAPDATPHITVSLGSPVSSPEDRSSSALTIDFPTDGPGGGPSYPLRVVSATGMHGMDTAGWDVGGSSDATVELIPPTPKPTLRPLSTSSVQVTIPDDNNADSYRVYRYPSSGTSSDASLVKKIPQDSDTDANVYVDTGLTRATGYIYYVTSVRDGIEPLPGPPASATTLSAPTVAGVATVQPGQIASTNVDDTGETTSLRFTAVDVGGPEISVFTLPDIAAGSTDSPRCKAFQISPSQVEINIEYREGATAKDVADLTNSTAECTAWVTASTDASEAAPRSLEMYVLRSKFGELWSAAGQDIKLTIDWGEGEHVTGMAAATAYFLDDNPAATAVTSGGTTTLTWTEGTPVADGDRLTIPADAVEVPDGTGNAETILDHTSGAWVVTTP